jgi:iron(III) transport system permease protein
VAAVERGLHAPASARRLLPAIELRWALTAFLALVLGWLVLPPLVVLIWTSLTEVEGAAGGAVTLENYARLAGQVRGAQVVANTLVYALAGAALATVLGTVLAWLVERTNAPLRFLAYATAFLSLSIPLIVKVLGFVLLLGPQAGMLNVWAERLLGTRLFDVYSLAGMILVDGLVGVPLSFLLVAPLLRAMDPGLEESAATCGASAWQTIRRVTLPLAWPAIAAVFLLNCLTTLQSLDVPAMIGIPGRVFVLTSQIYLELKGSLDPGYGDASALAVVLKLIVVLAFWPYHRLTRQASRYATITGRGFRRATVDLGAWRPVAALALLLLPALVLLPLLPIVWASLVPFYAVPSVEALRTVSLANYQVALANPTILRSLQNSLVVSTVSATATMLLMLLLAWLMVRGKSRLAARLDQLAMLPLVIPGIVLAIALLRLYLVVPLPVYGTLWIMILAFVAHYLPYGLRYSSTGLMSLHQELEESAAASGASWRQTLTRIVVPLIAPALVAGWLYVFLGSFRHLGIPILLYSPGTEVVAATIFDLWRDAQFPELAAFAVLLSAGLLVLACATHGLTRRQGHAP